MRLAIFTIIYNIVEGWVASFFGYTDDSLTLLGFGVDSFIESISGLGILHMITRIRAKPNSSRDSFERTALRVTGWSFYALVLGLLANSAYNLYVGQQPHTTMPGVVISVISIIIMLVLLNRKTKVGKALNSDAILADAECTRVCIYMSVVLLATSGIYYITKLPYLDSIGAVLLAYFSFQEGRECFEKAKSDKLCGCDHPEKVEVRNQ